MGSNCGHQATCLPATSTQFVLKVALFGQNRPNNSWYWWLGRLTFMEQILSRFSSDFLLSQCILDPGKAVAVSLDDTDSPDEMMSVGSGLVSPSDSISSSVAISVTSDPGSILQAGSMDAELQLLEGTSCNGSDDGGRDNSGNSWSHVSTPYRAQVENNLLLQMWYFAARATHVPNSKVGKVARRVIVWIAKILRDDQLSLEIVHDVVGLCHRTQAEGLLDRVLRAREASSSSLFPPSASSRGNRKFFEAQRKKEKTGEGDVRQSATPSPKNRKQGKTRRSSTSPSLSPIPLASSTLKNGDRDGKKGVRDRGKEGVKGGGKEGVKEGAERTKLSRQRSKGSKTGPSDDFIPSDDSFQSAVSELDLDCSSDTLLALSREGGVTGGVVDEDSSASGASTSHDSWKSGDHQNVKFLSQSSSNSNSSIGKGVGPEGMVSGFPNKPGYMG